MSNQKGILEYIREGATVADYDSSKGITMPELVELFSGLMKEEDNKRKNGWKPEYILGKWEAENLTLWQLQWMGENYRVLCSLEVSNIVKEREKHKP